MLKISFENIIWTSGHQTPSKLFSRELREHCSQQQTRGKAGSCCCDKLFCSAPAPPPQEHTNTATKILSKRLQVLKLTLCLELAAFFPHVMLLHHIVQSCYDQPVPPTPLIHFIPTKMCVLEALLLSPLSGFLPADRVNQCPLRTLTLCLFLIQLPWPTLLIHLWLTTENALLAERTGACVRVSHE